MNKFGFSRMKPRFIDYESNNRMIAEFIDENEPSFRLCIECGCCASACTTGNFTRFSLRELNILIKRGENTEAAAMVNKCMLCGKCILVCPRGVNTRNVLMLAREAYQKQIINAH